MSSRRQSDPPAIDCVRVTLGEALNTGTGLRTPHDLWIDPVSVHALPPEMLEWEGVAADILHATGCDDPPVDAYELATRCEFEIEELIGTQPTLDLERRIIRIRNYERPELRHMEIAHELGHMALERAGLPNVEPGAKHVAGAFMLPRWRIDIDLRTSWSIERLRRIHANVSAEAIAIRITQLRDAVTTIIDPRGKKRPDRRASPWITDPRVTRKAASRFEQELAAAAYTARAEVRAEDIWPDERNANLCYAFPVVFGDYHRVIVVCEREQLSLRL